jgi:hypothetical protein
MWREAPIARLQRAMGTTNFGPDRIRLDQRMCSPEMLRAITRRWISEVPSKIV